MFEGNERPLSLSAVGEVVSQVSTQSGFVEAEDKRYMKMDRRIRKSLFLFGER